MEQEGEDDHGHEVRQSRQKSYHDSWCENVYTEPARLERVGFIHSRMESVTKLMVLAHVVRRVLMQSPVLLPDWRVTHHTSYDIEAQEKHGSSVQKASRLSTRRARHA